MLILSTPLLVVGVGGWGFGATFKATTLACMLCFVFYSFSRVSNISALYAAFLTLYVLINASISLINGMSINGVFADSYYLFVLICTILALGMPKPVPFSRRIFFVIICCALALHLALYLVVGYENGFTTTFYGGTRINTSMGPATAAILYLSLLIFSIYYNSQLLKSLTLMLIYFTGSRTSSVIATLIFCHSYLYGNKNNSLRIAFCFVIFSICIIYMIQNLDRSSSLNVFDIAELSSINLNSSGRFDLWDYLWKHLDFNLFGNGFGAINNFITNDFSASAGYDEDQPHNDYLRIAYNQGLSGFLIFFTWLTYIVKKSAKKIANLQCIYYFIFALLLSMTTDNVLIYPFFLYPFFMMVLLALSDQQSNNGAI